MSPKVLIIEPSPTQGQIIEFVLADAGYKARIARTAALARQLMAQQPADVVIVNYTLPDGSGSQLCEQLKSQPEPPCIIVIAESGSATQILESLAAGADGFCIKSNDFAHLPDQVERTLQQAASDRQRLTDVVQLDGRDYRLSLTPAQWLDVLTTTLADLADLKQRCRDLSRRLADDPDPGNISGDAVAQALTPLTILLAEDSKTNQILAKSLLEKAGHTVLIAANGNEVLAYLDDPTGPSIDLILMDIEMPEMDGLEATRQIRVRESGGSHHLPILAMTAHASDTQQQTCLQTGMNACLTKPLNLTELTEALHS